MWMGPIDPRRPETNKEKWFWRILLVALLAGLAILYLVKEHPF